MPRRIDQSRRSLGSTIADLPAVLWVMFVLILYPLLDLAAVAMRYTFMLTTSREAVMSASRAKTFYADASASDQSARNWANSTAAATASKFTGVKINSVTTNLLVTNLATNTVQRYSTPLPTPADTSDALYTYEVTVIGTVMPLVAYKGPLWANVPGLTGPMFVSITSEKMCENTQGLNQ